MNKYGPRNPVWLQLKATGYIDVGTEAGTSWNIWNSVHPQLSFTPAEHERGKKVLISMGIAPGEPFVCFCSRDRAYLDQMHKYRSRDQWAYHDYRDCGIQNYLPAAEFFAKQGIWAL